MEVNQISLLCHLANLLFVFMPPSEVFCVLRAVVAKTHKIKNGPNAEKQVPMLRWHIPTDGGDHAQLISTFIDGYIEIKYQGFGANKGRSILDKCYNLEFNFDMLIHQMLNTLCTNIVPLEVALHIATVFLLEGQKTLFRFMYSVIKCNKDFFLALDTKQDLIKKLQENSLKNMKLDEFIRFAYLKSWATRGFLGGLGATVRFNQYKDILSGMEEKEVKQ